MAVLPMKHMLLCGMKKDRKAILELLQREGVVEIDSEPETDSVFSKTDMSSQSSQFIKEAEAAEEALTILERLVPDEDKPSSIKGRKQLTVSEYEEKIGNISEIVNEAHQILTQDRKVTDLKVGIPKQEMAALALTPWRNLNVPLDLAGTRTTDMIAGSIPEEKDREAVLSEIAESHPDLDAFEVDVISRSEEQTCLCFFVRKEERSELEDALRLMNFAKAPLSKMNPAQEITAIETQIEADKASIEALEEGIKECAKDRDRLRFVSDYFRMRAEKYDVISALSQSKRTFLLGGYLPAEDVPALQKKLDGFDAAVSFEEPDADADVPVKLKNGAFAGPLESVVESYSMPGKGEFDPTKIMAPFYYICFGLMLSDMAYGLIMAIGCAVMLKKHKNMEEGMRKFLTMFLYCGISTAFWGLLFGSFFGDAVNVIATTFFHRPDIRFAPLWFEPVNKPMKMLVFAFAVGIIHLFTGLGVKMYSCIKAGKIKDAICDCVFWYLLVGGAIVYLLTMSMITEMLGLSFILPASVGKAAAIAALVGALGIILTAGRESKNWFKRILKGLYGVYGITGYLSDVLSYSRLLALGLATGVISTVFNKMGSMLGASIPGVILFILVFVIGHAMNIAINALGAYVHTNRLQYVEFFGKFYEGGGRKIEPFCEHTKYYKVKEAE